jgi:hypothetical protein
VGGQLFHTIRRSDGSWLAFKDVEQGAGHFGDVNRVTAVQLHAELHVIAVPLTGRLRYAFLRVDGTWNAVAGIETQTNEVGGADSVALATIGDELHLAATFPLSSTVFRHTVRSADGHWLPFEADVRPQTGGVGVVGTIAAVRIGQEMHVVGVRADNGGLFHTVRRADGTWLPARPIPQSGSSIIHPIGDVDTIAAARIDDELHITATTDFGAIVHTARRPDDTWLDLDLVPQQIVGAVGTATGSAIAGLDGELHLVATVDDGTLLHTIRRADGSWDPLTNITQHTGDVGAVLRVSPSTFGAGPSMSARTVHTPPDPFIRYGCVAFAADVILAAALAPAWVDRAVADQDPMPHVLRSGPVDWSYRPRGPAAR